MPGFDTTKVVRLPSDTFRYYRTDIQLVFKREVSDSAKAAFFQRQSMTVLGVTRAGVFFVRIPDPGPTSDELFRTVAAIRAAPEVETAAAIPMSGEAMR